MVIKKSNGLNKSEEYISKLCEISFLNLWVYPNLYKNKGQELCDILVVFHNSIFIFSVKDIVFNENKKPNVAWERWKRKAIDESIKQVNGAARWIKEHPNRIFLDCNCTQPIPIKIMPQKVRIFKIIVAFGIEKACKEYFMPNSTGSVPVIYCDDTSINIQNSDLFCLKIDKTDIVHILDDYSSSVLFSELDTIADIKNYYEAKEAAINMFDFIMTTGEEDILAVYLLNMYNNIFENPALPLNEPFSKDAFLYPPDSFKQFQDTIFYKKQKELNKDSYLIDNMLQKTMNNALRNKLLGNEDGFNGEGAIKELTKLPRLMRRNLSLKFKNAIEKFPLSDDPLFRQVSSIYDKRSKIAYIFLQVNYKQLKQKFKEKSRELKILMLEVAATTYMDNLPTVEKVIGIGVNAPLYNEDLMEDFLLIDRNMLTADFLEYCKKANELFDFWNSSNSYRKEATIHAYQDITQLLN